MPIFSLNGFYQIKLVVPNFLYFVPQLKSLGPITLFTPHHLLALTIVVPNRLSDQMYKQMKGFVGLSIPWGVTARHD